MIYALLDSGCTTSFIKRSLADTLALEGTPINLRIQTLGERITEGNYHQMVEFIIENHSASISMKAATIKTICTQIHTIDPNTWKQFDTLEMACPKVTGKVDISILIGVDYLGEIYDPATSVRNNSIPKLICTKFGHYLMGTTKTKQKHSESSPSMAFHTVSVFTGKTSIQQDLTNLWSLEAMGIQDPDNEQFTASEIQAIEHFQKNTIMAEKKVNGVFAFQGVPFYSGKQLCASTKMF